MSQTSKFIDRQWRVVKLFTKIFPVFILLITAINIWDDAKNGKPFDSTHLVYAVGFLLWLGVVYFFTKLIFKFVREDFPQDGDCR